VNTREMVEGGPGLPAGHTDPDVPEGRGRFAFGSEWSGIAKLSEECGELVTVIGKLMATDGDPRHWQGDLRARLEDELADVGAAIAHVLHHCPLNLANVGDRSRVKRGLFSKWHDDGLRYRDETAAMWAGKDGP
jgi:hypothetical protein